MRGDGAEVADHDWPLLNAVTGDGLAHKLLRRTFADNTQDERTRSESRSGPLHELRQLVDISSLHLSLERGFLSASWARVNRGEKPGAQPHRQSAAAANMFIA